MRTRTLQVIQQLPCQLLCAGLLFFSGLLQAQDVHFTQFFSNPLILNPAQTGFYNGNYRVGFNFKAQWPWPAGNTMYHTESPYVDFSIGENKLRSGWMGVGFSFLNDEAGDGRLTFRRIGLCYAYHQPFDRAKRFVLSAGISFHYSIRAIDFTRFSFNNQWIDDSGFNLSISSNEPFLNERFSYFDLAGGLNFSAKVSDKLKLFVGASLLHINQPKNSFYGRNEKLGLRYQVNIGSEITLSDNLSMNINAYYGFEKRASELLFGSMLAYNVSRYGRNKADHSLYAGAYYRVKDALAPLIGYQYKQTRLLLNYDIVLSGLMRPGKGNGGPELSLVHVGRWSKSKNGKINCPKF
jgi:type IX secretion system PorP/SprF family membrane protein